MKTISLISKGFGGRLLGNGQTLRGRREASSQILMPRCGNSPMEPHPIQGDGD